MISAVEIDLAIICCCLLTLQAFMRRLFPGFFKSSLSPSNPVVNTFLSNKRANKKASKLGHESNPELNRQAVLADEEVAGGPYQKLDEDGKSNQSYVMTTMEAKPGST